MGKKYQSVTKSEETEPQNWNDPPFWRVSLLYGIAASTAIALSSDAPLLPTMVTQQFNLPEESVGISVGLIQGIYSLAQFFSCFYLGFISDRFGRRPVLLFGLFMMTFIVAGFGLSPSLAFAVSLRGILGLIDAGLPVSKAMLSDLTRQSSPMFRTVTFAYFGAVFSLSRSISTAVTGLLSKIELQQPIFLDHPVLFPCLIISLPIFVTFVFCWLFLRESVVIKLESVQLNSATPDPVEETELTMSNGVQEIFKDPQLQKLNAVYCLNMFANGALIIGITLFTTHNIEEGGMGMSAFGSGMAMFQFGAVAFVFQVTIFKHVVKYFGLRKTFCIFGCLGLGIGVASMPLASIVLRHSQSTWAWTVSWLCLSLSLTFCSVGHMTLLPVHMTMLSNSSNPKIYGLTQGLNQSLGSLMRGASPIVFGAFFSFTAKRHVLPLTYLILGALYWIGYFIGISLSDAVEQSRDDTSVVEKQELEMSETNKNADKQKDTV